MFDKQQYDKQYYQENKEKLMKLRYEYINTHKREILKYQIDRYYNTLRDKSKLPLKYDGRYMNTNVQPLSINYSVGFE